MTARKLHDGQRFGRWTVLEAYPQKPKRVRRLELARCRCDCGTKKYVRRVALVHSRSAGCRKCYKPVANIAVDGVLNGWKLVQADRETRAYVFEHVACGTRRTLTHRTVPPGVCGICEPSLSSPAARARTGVSRQAIHQRIARGWSIEDATTLPRSSRS